MVPIDPSIIFARGDELWIVDRYQPVAAVADRSGLRLERIGNTLCRNRWRRGTPFGAVFVSRGIDSCITVIRPDGTVHWRRIPGIPDNVGIDVDLDEDRVFVIITSDHPTTQLLMWRFDDDAVENYSIAGRLGYFVNLDEQGVYVAVITHQEEIRPATIYRFDGHGFVSTDLDVPARSRSNDRASPIKLNNHASWPDPLRFRKEYGEQDATGEPMDVLVYLQQPTEPPAEHYDGLFPSVPIWLSPRDEVAYRIELPGRMWVSTTIGSTVYMIVDTAQDSRVFVHEIGSVNLREFEGMGGLDISGYIVEPTTPNEAEVMSHIERSLGEFRDMLVGFRASHGAVTGVALVASGVHAKVAVEFTFARYPEETFVVYHPLFANDGTPIHAGYEDVEWMEMVDTGRVPPPERWRRDDRGRIVCGRIRSA